MNLAAPGNGFWEKKAKKSGIVKRMKTAPLFVIPAFLCSAGRLSANTGQMACATHGRLQDSPYLCVECSEQDRGRERAVEGYYPNNLFTNSLQTFLTQARFTLEKVCWYSYSGIAILTTPCVGAAYTGQV